VIGAITAGLYAGGVPPVTNSYESIATVTVGSGGSASIDFTSIPSTYKHLQIRCLAQTSNGSNVAGFIRFNGNTTISNYSLHLVDGNGSSVSAYGASSDYCQFSIPPSSSSTFSATVIDILDYTDTNKYKTIRSLSGYDANGSGQVRYSSGGYYANTNAITSINLVAAAGNMTQYSSFALYGIKG
jgi:hypothetical protein